MSKTQDARRKMQFGVTAVVAVRNSLFIAILLLAALLRLYRLDAIPPGLTHDEASNGHDAAAVLGGVRPIYFTIGYGHEPLYTYSVALTMLLLGPTATALRLTTVAWGLALILLTYEFTRRLFGSPPALLAAAWMAVSFWCIMTSRVGLRAVTLAVIFTASALCFWLGFSASGNKPRRRWVWYVLSGVFLGVSIYTYMASRAMPFVYVLLLVYLAVLCLAGLRRPFPNWQWQGIVVLLLIAGLVAVPLIHFLVTHPEAEQRIEQLSEPLERAAQGDFSGLWRNVTRTLRTFTLRGDPMWRYNVAGRPLLDPASGLLFYVGILISLWRWRDPRYAFLLLWLIAGVGPALLAGPDATVLRTIAAQPAIFILVALALTAVLQFLSDRAARWGQITGMGGVVVIVAIIGLGAARDYFDVWGQHREVRVTYYHALAQQAHYLDTQPEDGIVALSSIYPGRFHDPYPMEIALRRDDLSLRWFDGRFALVFPNGGEARVIIPTIASLDAALEPTFAAHTSHLHTETFRPDDLIPRFDVYRLDTDAALAAFLATASHDVVSPPFALPVNVGDVVELIGYDLRTPIVEPGETVELLTAWRVRAPFASEAIFFTHLLDPDNHVVGQVDRLDVPSYHWQSGDAFIQLHRFPVDAAAPPGICQSEVGIYTQENPTRLPILVDGAAVDNRILLSPVEISE
jgi:4-amino-4-deoxy-L-arabinose transferase-like glycosyltransferase